MTASASVDGRIGGERRRPPRAPARRPRIGNPRAQRVAARGLGFGHHGERQVRRERERQGGTDCRRRRFRARSRFRRWARGARVRRATARISPRSTQSCAWFHPETRGRPSAVRTRWCSRRRGRRLRPPSRRASSTASSRAATDRSPGPGNGHSYSARAWRPAPRRLRRTLERLDPAPSDAPNAQRDAVALQPKVGRVEIGAGRACAVRVRPRRKRRAAPGAAAAWASRPASSASFSSISVGMACLRAACADQGPAAIARF